MIGNDLMVVINLVVFDLVFVGFIVGIINFVICFEVVKFVIEMFLLMKIGG